ncbi:hypothetical protein C8R46DRAFT_1229383 [Mycena filopes]|nr:hypothetical protein C8R46DRAFT_1229383 [Mycena filopes]
MSAFRRILILAFVPRAAGARAEAVVGLTRLPELADFDFKRLPFVGALAREGWPAFPIGVPHFTTEDVKDSTVILNACTLSVFDPKMFEGPEVFIPDRFLKSEHGTRWWWREENMPRQHAAIVMQLTTMRLIREFSFGSAVDPKTGQAVGLDFYAPEFVVVPHPFARAIEPRSVERRELVEQAFKDSPFRSVLAATQHGIVHAAVPAMAHPRRTLHDKTSYSILPTPPSPTRITSPSPSLSPSNSNSAGSSVEPATPPSQPRGRVRKPYPESVGRVPLHRRGTSKTYERLEDLLREAGYKETRIFTPEAPERTVPQPQDEIKSPTIASFVGFLSNLVPSRSASLKRDDEPEASVPEVNVPVYSPPTSPSLSRTPRPFGHATRNSTVQPQPRRGSNATTVVPRPSSPLSVRRGSNAAEMSGGQRPTVPRNTASGPLSPRRSMVDMQQQQRQRVDSVVPPLPVFNQHQQHPSLHHPVPDRPVNRYYQHHPSSSRASGVSSPPPPSMHQPTPTRASAYLRHMTSYDRDRPQSTPPLATAYSRVTDDAEEESLLSPTLPPRMPTNWMDNVKRARDYFAPLPPISDPPLATSTAGKLGRSVSAKTRGRLSDRTNANASPVPPLLTTRLSTARARRSESQVSASRVVCRSRGSSPVRRDKGKTREADLDLRGHIEMPPDLHQTERDLVRSRFLGGGWGVESAQLLSPPRRREGPDFDSGESDGGASSDGEDEITLARILVPSRHEQGGAPIERSRSVRSLRKCLELDGQGGGEMPPPPVPALPVPNGSGRWSVSLSWGRARAAGEDGDDEASGGIPTNSRGSVRQRGGMPAWGS